MICLHCSEAVDPAQPFEVVNGGAAWLHRECLIRMTVGSVGHQSGRCSCHGGTEEDPAGLTPREAARAAAQLFWRLSEAKAVTWLGSRRG